MSFNISRLPARNIQSDTNDERDRRRLRARAKAAAEVAAQHAEAVDREARFPREAFAAIREQKLLGILIPAALGGEEASPAEVAEICYILGGACASAAMIFAMHQVKIGCLVRHARGVAWQENLQRRIAAEQLLMASSTTEGSN